MAKRAEYGKNKQICVISISRRTRLKFTSLFSATFLFSLLVPMRQHYLFAYDITCPRRQACVRRLLQSYAVGMQKSLFECWLTADELTKLTVELIELLDTSERHGSRNWASRKPYGYTPMQAKNRVPAMLPPTAKGLTWAKACIWTANGCSPERKSTAAVPAAV